MNLALTHIMPYVAFVVVCMLFTIPAIWGFFFTKSVLGTLSQFLDTFLASQVKTRQLKEQNTIKIQSNRYSSGAPYPFDAYLKISYVLLPIVLTVAFAVYEVTSIFSLPDAEKTNTVTVTSNENLGAPLIVPEDALSDASNKTSNGNEQNLALDSQPSEQETSSEVSQHPGSPLYQQNCVSCHQANGKGLAGAFPPLANSEWVINDTGVLIKILLKGINGPITVDGQAYNGIMPAFENTFSDQELADLLSYIRSDFGNNAEAISAEQVTNIRNDITSRTASWTEAELQ